MSEGSNIAFSPPALPPFLQVVPAARVVLCLAHGGCYTRRNIARHLGEQHQLQRQVKKQALALEAANIATDLKEAQHPAHGAEAISGLLLLDSFRCLHIRCGHNSVNVEAIKQHCFQAHRWRRKHQVAQVEDEGRLTLPYRLAKLQTLFTKTKQRQYSEAHLPRSTLTLTLDVDAAPGRHEGEDKCNAPGSERAGESMERSWLSASGPQWETVMGRYWAAQRFHKTGQYAAMEEEAAHISEITPWLKSTGFAAHLAGVEVAGLPSSCRLPDPRRPQRHGETAEETALAAHLCRRGAGPAQGHGSHAGQPF